MAIGGALNRILNRIRGAPFQDCPRARLRRIVDRANVA
jgi:hypothetical protein